MKLDEMLSQKGTNYFYIMHLSYDGQNRESLWNYAKENNVIGLDYPDVVREEWNRVRQSVKDRLPRIWVKQFDMFCHEIRSGDIVVILEGWHSLLGIAEVLRGYRYRRGLSEDETFFDHVRQVRWLKKYDYGQHPRLPYPINGFRNTLYKVNSGTRRWLNLSTIEF